MGHNPHTFSGTDVPCEHCSTLFYKTAGSDRRFCSKQCWYAFKSTKSESAAVYATRTANVPRGEDSPHWKGDAVGYSGLHYWVRKNLGKAAKCEECHTTETYRFEWANKSGLYLRSVDDWMSLCVKCHRRFDAARRPKKPLRYERETHCSNGHEYAVVGVYLNGQRTPVCKKCQSEKSAAYYQRRQAKERSNA